MGNLTEVTVNPTKGEYFVVTNKQFKEMKRIMSSEDEMHDIEAKKHDENTMEIYSLYARGTHGEFKDFIDRAKEFKPLKGDMFVFYHDIEAPQILRKTIKAKKSDVLKFIKPSGKMQSMSGWHKQTVRHSKARKYGHAGGVYKTRIKRRW